MMNTRMALIMHADELIRSRGYNAFSYQDLSKILGIKTASIHYHFPTKKDLGVAVIKEQMEALMKLRQETHQSSSIDKLNAFFQIYERIFQDGKVCLVGSLAPDYYTLDPEVQSALRSFSEAMVDWVSGFLRQGKKEGIFHFDSEPVQKARLLIGNAIASLQLDPLLQDKNSFYDAREVLISELCKKN